MKKRFRKKYHRKWIAEISHEISVCKKWRGLLFSVSVGYPLLIDKTIIHGHSPVRMRARGCRRLPAHAPRREPRRQPHAPFPHPRRAGPLTAVSIRTPAASDRRPARAGRCGGAPRRSRI